MPSGRLLAVALAAMVAIAFPAAGSDEPAPTRTFAVGLHDNPPRIFPGEDGGARGFFPDIIDHLARKRGWEIFYVPCEFQDCLQMVRRGEIDILPDVARTRERERLLRFGNEPVLQSWSYVVQPPAAERRISDVEDLDGLRVAVLENSIEARRLAYLRDNRTLDIVEMRRGSMEAIMAAVEAGAADAGIVNRHFAESAGRRFDVVRSDLVFQPAALHLVFSPGVEEQLITGIDMSLALLKADPGSPYYLALERWFAPDPVFEIPERVWIAISAGAALLVVSLAVNAHLRRVVARRTAELRESQNRLKAIFDNAPVEIYLKDAEGRFLEVNRQFERLFDVSSEEIRGKLPAEVHYPELAERTRAHDLHILQTGDVYVREEPAMTEYGKRMLHTVKFPIVDERQRVNGIGAVVTDVTEQYAARQRMLEVEQRLVDAVNALPAGFWLFDADDRLILFNERMAALFPESAPAMQKGASFAEILRYGLERGQYPEAEGREEQWLAERLEARARGDTEYEYRLRGGRWVKSLNRRMSDGGTVGFRLDITDLKHQQRALETARAEAEATTEKLREQTRKLAQVAEISGVGGWELDLETGALAWDPITRAIHEVDERFRPDRRTAIDFYARHARPSIEKALRDCIDRRLPFDLELELDTATGRRIWVRATGQPVVEGGRVTRLTGAFQDITAQKVHERALEKSRLDAEKANVAKSQFLANMSHEIRTPMNGVTGMLALLLNSDLGEIQRKQAQTAFDSASGLMSILNDILDYSKLEADAMRLESIEFSLAKVIDEVVAMLSVRAQEKGLRLAAEIDPAVPEMLKGDPQRVRQILVNLAGNAVKFTDEGSVRIIARAGARDGGPVTVSVIDTGIGISAEAQRSLFDRFAQADASINRRYGGTGLGLAISKQLVEALGGSIGVESASGHGSHFWFTLPTGEASLAPVIALRPARTKPRIVSDRG